MLDRIGERGGQIAAGHHWPRLIYLTNCSVALVAVAVYLFGVRLPPVGNLYLSELAGIAVVYGVVFLLWFLIEGLGYVEQVPSLYHLYPNAGLRELDLALAVLAVLGLWLAWRSGFANAAIWILGGLTLANSVISALQLRRRYTLEDIGTVPDGQ